MRPGPSLTLDHHHPVRAAQVVIKCLRPGQRALVVGPGQQVMHEVPAQPQFGVGDAAQPGQLHRQHGRAVLEGHQVGVVRLRPGSMSARTPSTSGRGDASRTSRSPSWTACWPASAGAAGARAWRRTPSGTVPAWPGPAQAARLPYRSSIATGMPVSSCRALAIPGWPAPDTATWVSRSWMSMLRCRLATVWASAALVAASSAAVARSLACSRAFDTATPVCCAMTWIRNRSSADGSARRRRSGAQAGR